MNTKRECLFSVFCLCSFTFLNKTTDCSFNAKPITLMNPVIRFECSGGLKRLRRAAAVFQCWLPFGVWAELLVSLSLCWSSSALITAVIINCVDDDDDVTACRLTCVCFQREPTSQPVSTTSWGSAVVRRHARLSVLCNRLVHSFGLFVSLSLTCRQNGESRVA